MGASGTEDVHSATAEVQAFLDTVVSFDDEITAGLTAPESRKAGLRNSL